jgi:hypothetical protein
VAGDAFGAGGGADGEVRVGGGMPGEGGGNSEDFVGVGSVVGSSEIDGVLDGVGLGLIGVNLGQKRKELGEERTEDSKKWRKPGQTSTSACLLVGRAKREDANKKEKARRQTFTRAFPLAQSPATVIN